jgi:hypothetical protein
LKRKYFTFSTKSENNIKQNQLKSNLNIKSLDEYYFDQEVYSVDRSDKQ